MRRHARTAAGDAILILAEDERSATGPVYLDQVYVERTLEKDLLAELKAPSSRAPIVILGEAGTGKTSLLWRLHRELQMIPTCEIWLVKASVARTLEASFLEEAIEQAQGEAKDPILLLDTVDMLLHSEEDRDRLLALLEVMEERKCRIVMTCRPRENRLLPRNYRSQPRPPLGNYDEDELERAIGAHVQRFYARANIRDPAEHRIKLTQLVAAHHSLREICIHPLTLRMLFVLYAPEEVPSEIDVVSLYDRFWEDRVRTDRRAGMTHPDEGALDLCRAAGALAISMLSEGSISVDLGRAREILREEEVPSKHLDALLGRGVLQMSGDGSVEFFHQTFFEHAAARGLLDTLHGHGLDLLKARVMTRPDDLLTVAVLEQTLLISSAHDAGIRTVADGVFKALLQSKQVTLASAAIVVYAHMPRVSPELSQQAAIAMESSLVADRFIASIASIRRERVRELFVHLGVIWRRAIGERKRWANCEHILDELPRLAARGGADAVLVRSFLDTFGVREAVLGQDPGAAADRSLLVILSALAPHDPHCWDDFVVLCRGLPDRPSNADRLAAVLQAIASQADHLGRSRVAHDLADAIGMDRAPFSGEVERGWGALWAAEWRLCKASIADMLVELRGASGIRFQGMLSGLREHLLVGSQADALAAWDAFCAERDVQRQARWSRTVWQELLGAISNRGAAAAAVGQEIARLLADPSTERLLAMQLGKSMRAALFPDEIAIPLLSDPRVAVPARWLQLNDLGLLLPLAHLRGHKAAMAAMEQLIYSPDAFDPKLHESTIKALVESARFEPAALALFFRLAVVTGDAAALLKIIEAPSDAIATKTLEHSAALEALADRLKNSSKGDDRRLGLRLWLVILNQGFGTHAPSTHDLLQRFARESDARARGWLARLIGESGARENNSDAIAVLLKAARDPDANIRSKSFDGLLRLVRGLSVVDAWVEQILNLALECQTDAGRLRQVGWLVVDLVPQHISLATTLIERLVTAPAVERLGSAGKRELRSKLRSPMRAWMSAASTAARRAMLDLACRIEPDLGCMLIDAASREVFDEVSGQLGGMLADSSVHDRVKRFIGMQLRLRQRRERGAEWPELTQAIAARHGRDLPASCSPQSNVQSTPSASVSTSDQPAREARSVSPPRAPQPSGRGKWTNSPSRALLTQADADDLVKRIEACAAARDSQTRALIIERLPDDIRARVAHAPRLRDHVTGLVETCADFPTGLRALREAVHWFEGDTISMRGIDELLVQLGILSTDE